MKILRALGGWMGEAAKRRRLYVALALPATIPLLLSAVRVQPEISSLARGAMIPPPRVSYEELKNPLSVPLTEHSLVLTVEKNDTLAELLRSGGLSAGESAQLSAEMGKTIDLRRLRDGQMIRFHYDRMGSVDAVQMKITGWGELNAVRNGTAFDVEARPATVRRVETTISATIRNSLYDALREQGENPQLVQQLIDIFQWDIDFFQLRGGDSFSLVVSKQYAGSDLIGYSPIAAARFTHKGNTYEAFRHEKPDGSAGYYSSRGTPLRKQFLKSPVAFTRVTSGFSKRRFHPVLKYFRPHYGVDYGAPVGTPVMTTADGVVVEARFKPAEGNFIRIRHSSKYDSCYLHLSRFKKGLKRGMRVTQGDVIGYVGSTGLATGPHLDYRVSENGKWLNPQNLKSITPDPLGGRSLATFRANVARWQPRLAAPAETAVAQKRMEARALF